MSVSNSLLIELFADGGIRLTSMDGETELASLPATLDRIAEANREGVPVHLRGELTAPLAVPVVEQVRRLASSLDEAPSEPAPWPKRRSSMQTAAVNGLTEQVADLLDRGSSPHVGSGWRTPYRLAMRRGHTDVLVVLRDAGVGHPRGLAPPPVLPDAVVLRAYTPALMWWLLVPCGALAVAATVDGAYLAVPVFLITPLLGIATVHLIFGNTRCAVDGPYVARLRGRRWQGPVDLRTLDALGHTPRGTPSMPLIWVLGQREAGERPNVYSKSAFDKRQLLAIKSAGLRFVPLYAAGGFMSPGFERLVARHLDPTNVIVGRLAAERIWPVRKTHRP